jgi:hypothetical protein
VLADNDFEQAVEILADCDSDLAVLNAKVHARNNPRPVVQATGFESKMTIVLNK